MDKNEYEKINWRTPSKAELRSLVMFRCRAGMSGSCDEPYDL